MNQPLKGFLDQLSEFMTEQELEVIRTFSDGREEEALAEILSATLQSQRLITHAKDKGLPGSEIELKNLDGEIKLQTKKHGRGKNNNYYRTN
jgi:hypothetical protein